jgi:hypothetical protein
MTKVGNGWKPALPKTEVLTPGDALLLAVDILWRRVSDPGRWPLGYITGMRPLNVQKLQDKIAALSSDLSQLEVKRDQVIARRPGLAESDRPAFFRDVTVVFESTRRRSVVCT